MKVDDFGCYSNNPKLIRSTLFPLLIDEVREADISRWMAECQKAGLILFYEVESKPYIQVTGFKQRLRQKVKKYPHPPEKQSQSDDGHMSDNGRLETKRNETETKGLQKFDPDDFYQSGAQAFESIKNDELMVEKLLRIIRGNGFQACTELALMLAVKKFFTIEEAKPEFKFREKSEVKRHLVNWINKQKWDE
jgi:hypothetical protein